MAISINSTSTPGEEPSSIAGCRRPPRADLRLAGRAPLGVPRWECQCLAESSRLLNLADASYCRGCHKEPKNVRIGAVEGLLESIIM